MTPESLIRPQKVLPSLPSREGSPSPQAWPLMKPGEGSHDTLCSWQNQLVHSVLEWQYLTCVPSQPPVLRHRSEPQERTKQSCALWARIGDSWESLEPPNHSAHAWEHHAFLPRLQRLGLTEKRPYGLSAEPGNAFCSRRLVLVSSEPSRDVSHNWKVLLCRTHHVFCVFVLTHPLVWPLKSPRIMNKCVVLYIYFFNKSRFLCAFKNIKTIYISGILSLISFVLNPTLDRSYDLHVTWLLRHLFFGPCHSLG